jgi:prepilin-type N-terminal cleavage/methylation domain-containing protein
MRCVAATSPSVLTSNASRGFSLIELLVCLGLMAALTMFASPYWARWQARVQVETTRDQLIHDLQSARLIALQQGQAVWVSRVSNCAWASSAGSDWSCGWQISLKANGQVLRTSAQARAVQISFSKNDPIEINALGDLGQIGDRWTVKALPTSLNLSQVVCLNSASRIRWQVGDTCSS